MSTCPADIPYWAALAEGRLKVQCCQSCGTWAWPPVSRCGTCGNWEPDWRETPLTGRLYSWIRTCQPFGGSEEIPFVSLLVELPAAGGKRLMALYEGDESKLAIGMALTGRIDHVDVGGRQVPVTRWTAA